MENYAENAQYRNIWLHQLQKLNWEVSPWVLDNLYHYETRYSPFERPQLSAPTVTDTTTELGISNDVVKY